MRGNRRRISHDRQRAGSIPAYAGEPRSMPSILMSARVYPRVCGGTRQGASKKPHSRGSIPAYAGEPDGA